MGGNPKTLCAIIYLGAAIFVSNPLNQTYAEEICFDIPRYIKIREVQCTDSENQLGTKLIEGQFDISVHFNSTAAKQADELVFEITPGNPFHQVVDVSPRTRQTSSIEGPISIEKHDESNASIGVDVSGAYELLHGSTHAKNGSRRADILKYQQKPVQSTVIASGTIRRGTGAVVKLRKSNDSTLEGQHRITVTWEVPHQWQADLVQVSCFALTNVDRFVGNNETRVLDKTMLVVPIVVDEASALQKTKEFVRTDQRFRNKVDAWQPSGIDGWLEKNYREAKLTAKEIFSGKKTHDWKELIYRLDTRIDTKFVRDQMPKSLTDSAEQWVANRNRILVLSR